MQFIDLKTQQNRIREKIDIAIAKVLDHGQYVMGPEIKELEDALCNYTGSKYCISNASGTDALLLAMLALGIGNGDEVITSPFTFIATGEMIALIGAKPVFVDIDDKAYNIDPTKIEEKITDKTKAIMPVSLYGQCAKFDEINEVASKYNLSVIEDGAQSFGASYKNKKSSNLSTIGCTSFFPSKPLGGYGDGGACFTNDEEIAQKMSWLRVHGQDKRYHHPLIGINGRLDTIQAAILLEKMAIFEDEIDKREKIGARYSELLASTVVTPYIEKHNTSVYGQYTILVEKREQFLESMQAKNIPTAVHYPIPLNLQPAFSQYGQGEGSFPIAEKIANQVVSLPMHPYLSEQDQDLIVKAVKESV